MMNTILPMQHVNLLLINLDYVKSYAINMQLYNIVVLNIIFT